MYMKKLNKLNSLSAALGQIDGVVVKSASLKFMPDCIACTCFIYLANDWLKQSLAKHVCGCCLFRNPFL